MIFEYQRRIFAYNCDIYGHVNNSVYLQFFEEARSMALEQMGMPISFFVEKGIDLWVVRAELDYLYPIQNQDCATLNSTVTFLSKVKSCWSQTITNSAGKPCTNLYLEAVFASNGRPKRLPVDIYQNLAKYVQKP